MGLYSDTLKERERKEQMLVKEADDALRDQNFTQISSNPLDELQLLLARLFEKFHIKYKRVNGCKTTLELIECVLDTNKIMYEKVNINEPSKWKKSNSHIIAFTKGGAPILLSPHIFGYSYVGAWDNKAKRFSLKKLDLEEDAYIIFSPLPTKINGVWSMIKYVFTAMRPINMAVILISSLVVSLLGLIVPIINRWVTYDFLKTPAENKNWMIFLGIMVLTSTGSQNYHRIIHWNILSIKFRQKK